MAGNPPFYPHYPLAQLVSFFLFLRSHCLQEIGADGKHRKWFEGKTPHRWHINPICSSRSLIKVDVWDWTQNNTRMCPHRELAQWELILPLILSSVAYSFNPLYSSHTEIYSDYHNKSITESYLHNSKCMQSKAWHCLVLVKTVIK